MRPAVALKHRHEIHTLARDLGIDKSRDPVRAIIRYCETQAVKILRDYPSCATLTEFLGVMEAALDTKFEEVRTDDELANVQTRYSEKGEVAFASLHHELDDDVYGITYKRMVRKPWERQYVSVIDCRGEKQYRSYFTKWHELGHLLVLTDQGRLKFLRTHAATEQKDPEEALVDTIAGRIGFFPRFVRAVADERASFEKFEAARTKLCPEASKEASAIGFAAAWPSPCLLLRAEEALRRGEEAKASQPGFGFYEPPKPVLRAVSTQANDAARGTDLMVFPNMRVPANSIIYSVFAGMVHKGAADEDLSWWETSGGQHLPELGVRVQARLVDAGQNGDLAVQALVTPL